MPLPMPTDQLFRQAMQHHHSGQFREAESLYRQILAHYPEHGDSLQMLGILSHQTGRGEQGVELLRRAVQSNPNAPEYHANLGAILAGMSQPEAAAAEFRQALLLRPDSAETHSNLGKALRALGDLDGAIESLRKAVTLKPNLPESHNQLGDCLRDTGQLDEAIASYRRAMALSPDPRWGSSLVHALYLHPDYTPRRIYEAHVRWNQTHAEPLASSVPMHRNDPASDRRLKIGYVSAEFQETPNSRLFLPLLGNHDRSKFEVFCYSNVPAPDATTQGFRAAADSWREIAALNDQQAAELVLRDGIDVLVDLSMHRPGNRLLLFARKPAPIQVTGLAYPGTTGLITIDYRLSDPHLETDTDNRFHSEQKILLPQTLSCWQPPADEHEVNELPALKNGFITFGCLNDFAWINRRTLELWVELLQAVENSRLLLTAPPGGSRQRLLDQFRELGIAPYRIEFAETSSMHSDFDLLRQVDLCLDTVPWSGRVDMVNALWIGVPVITFPGQTGVSRHAASILSNVGLTEWIADAAHPSARIAEDAVANLSPLAELRSTLRSRLSSSPIMNAPEFARQIETAYRTMWQNWCHNRVSGGIVAV